MTCYEHLRKKKNTNEEFNRIKGYLYALKTDQTEEYHHKHGRGLV